MEGSDEDKMLQIIDEHEELRHNVNLHDKHFMKVRNVTCSKIHTSILCDAILALHNSKQSNANYFINITDKEIYGMVYEIRLLSNNAWPG